MSVLLEREIGKKALLMGNEALVRGAYEAGLDYASCYPGTPSSEVSNLLYELQGAGGFRMDFATNEKVAMEAVAGASMGGLNCLTAMKHVGPQRSLRSARHVDVSRRPREPRGVQRRRPEHVLQPERAG